MPLVDEHDGRRIYDPALLSWTLAGALLGSLPPAIVAWLLSHGQGIAYYGQYFSGGHAVAVFTAASLGFAAGGLTGALLAVFLRLGRKRGHQQ